MAINTAAPLREMPPCQMAGRLASKGRFIIAREHARLYRAPARRGRPVDKFVFMTIYADFAEVERLMGDEAAKRD